MEEKAIRNSPKHSVSLFSTSSEKNGEKTCAEIKSRTNDACVSTLVGRTKDRSNKMANTTPPRIAPATFDGFPLTSADILFTGSVNSVKFQQNVPACLLPQTNCASPLHYVSAETRQQARRAITAQSKSGSRQAHVGNYFQSPEVWPPDHHCQSNLASWWGSASGVPSYQRRSLPCLSPAGMLKKTQQHPHLQSNVSSNFHRSTSFSGQLNPIQQNVAGGAFDDFVAHNDYLLVYQDHAVHTEAVTYAAFENPSCEESPVEQQQGVLRNNPCFQEGNIPDDAQLDHPVSSVGSSEPASKSTVEKGERFSRKVFIGGLPPDIDEEEITAAFRRFGPLVVDWPHKAESKSYFPPKGYCFLIFQEELSVQNFIEMCLVDEEKMYWCVSSPTMKDKPVQVRPWTLSDSDFVMDGSQPLDPRKTIFVGGVPRPLRAVELAMIMDRLYGGVCYAGIDTDPELKYPKGAGRVAFSNQQSYIAAISARFVQLQHGDIDKRVEVKPYVLDDQMCDECHGSRCAGKFAPFFCASVTCLQYYCEYCWAQIHSRPGREYHKPLVKEGADRPRAVPFRWC